MHPLRASRSLTGSSPMAQAETRRVRLRSMAGTQCMGPDTSAWQKLTPCLLLLAIVAGSPVSAVADARLHTYTVSIDPALSAISVRACFDGKPPPSLVSESLDAAAALDSAG